jgi:hypothetical protein
MSARDAVFKVPAHVVSEVLDGETVVLNLCTGRYFALNKTATRMWQLLREGLAFAQVSSRVATEFGTDLSRVERDLAGLLECLQERGLLEVG